MEFDKICDAVAKSLGVKNNLSYLILKQRYESNIYLTTDWHLWVKDRTAKIKPTPVYCRQNMDEILEQYEAREFPKNSLLIHLGDLVAVSFMSSLMNLKRIQYSMKCSQSCQQSEF